MWQCTVGKDTTIVLFQLVDNGQTSIFLKIIQIVPNLAFLEDGVHHRICNLRYGTHDCGRTAASYSSFSRSCLYMVSASVLIFRCSFQPESINLFFVILFIHNKFFFSPNSSPIVLTYCTILLVIQNSGSSIGTAQKLHLFVQPRLI